MRLIQGATFCEYDTFLDRMLIEQQLMGLTASSICDELIAKKQKLSPKLLRLRMQENNKLSNPLSENVKCTACNGNHFRRECRFRDSKCFCCGKTGHISRACAAKMGHLKADEDDEEPIDALQMVNVLKYNRLQNRKLIMVNVD